jgi:hypothetical protein
MISALQNAHSLPLFPLSVYSATKDCSQAAAVALWSSQKRTVMYRGANPESNNVGLDDSFEVVYLQTLAR